MDEKSCNICKGKGLVMDGASSTTTCDTCKGTGLNATYRKQPSVEQSELNDGVSPVFDLEAVYDDEISPLLVKIIEICKKHEMPMVASFCYRRDEEGGNDCCNTVLPFEDRQPERHKHANKAVYGRYDEHRTFSMAVMTTKG